MDVLIAHGSEDSRRDLATSLAGQGVNLVEAGHGAAALDVLMAAGAPRLALIDWDLPGCGRLHPHAADADELRARINVGRRFTALPWERIARATTGDSQRSPERGMHSAPELDAQRLADDAGLARDDGALTDARFELASVLVVQ